MASTSTFNSEGPRVEFVPSPSRYVDMFCIYDRFDGASATPHEDSARRIRELEDTVHVLEDQNVQLKLAAGALAERLNTRLMVESREAWRGRVREAFLA